MKTRKKSKNHTVQIIKATDEDSRIAVDVVYEPNVPDIHGQYMSTETVRKACESFNKALSEGIVKPNLFHVSNTSKFEIVKTWINEVECYIGDKLVPEGTWLAQTHYIDDDLWEMKKSGELQGISIGARGRIIPKDKGENQ